MLIMHTYLFVCRFHLLPLMIRMNTASILPNTAATAFPPASKKYHCSGPLRIYHCQLLLLLNLQVRS